MRDSCGKLLVIRWYIICAPLPSQSVLYMHMIHPLDYHKQYRYIGTAAGRPERRSFDFGSWKFWPWNFGPAILTRKMWPQNFGHREANKEEFCSRISRRRRQQPVQSLLKCPTFSDIRAVFVPNKFALDPFLCPATKLAKDLLHSDEVQFLQHI